MDPLVAHQRAQDAFAGVLAAVSPRQMGDPTPCTQWTVGDLIGHVIGGNEKVLIRAGLRQEPDASWPADLIEAHRASAAAAHQVFAAPDAMTIVFGLPIGPVPGSWFIWMRAVDGLVHAWDLAKATGQPTDLDPELAAYLLAGSRGAATDALRGPGKVFDDPQPCDEARSPADQLAAFLGRRVS
jgi:uncharacterized protein (TIGR03086 family)